MSSSKSCPSNPFWTNRFKPLLASSFSTVNLKKTSGKPRTISSLASIPVRKPNVNKVRCKRSLGETSKGSTLAVSLRRSLPRHKQLESLKVKDPTLLKYHQAVEKFQLYCRRRRLVNSTVSLADKHMAEYTTDLYEDGEPHNTASYALYGFCSLKLTRAVQTKTSWCLEGLELTKSTGVKVRGSNRSATEIQTRGRWRCQKSILRYQKPGQTLASMSRIPQQVWEDIKHALTRVLSILQKYYGSSRR